MSETRKHSEQSEGYGSFPYFYTKLYYTQPLAIPL